MCEDFFSCIIVKWMQEDYSYISYILFLPHVSFLFFFFISSFISSFCCWFIKIDATDLHGGFQIVCAIFFRPPQAHLPKSSWLCNICYIINCIENTNLSTFNNFDFTFNSFTYIECTLEYHQYTMVVYTLNFSCLFWLIDLKFILLILLLYFLYI